jgi:hypothetical protein
MPCRCCCKEGCSCGENADCHPDYYCSDGVCQCDCDCEPPDGDSEARVLASPTEPWEDDHPEACKINLGNPPFFPIGTVATRDRTWSHNMPAGLSWAEGAEIPEEQCLLFVTQTRTAIGCCVIPQNQGSALVGIAWTQTRHRLYVQTCPRTSPRTFVDGTNLLAGDLESDAIGPDPYGPCLEEPQFFDFLPWYDDEPPDCNPLP